MTHNCNKDDAIETIQEDVREIRQDVKKLLQDTSALKVVAAWWGSLGGLIPYLISLIIKK